MISTESMLIPFYFLNEHQTHEAAISAANEITNGQSIIRFYTTLISDLDGGNTNN